MTDGLKQRLREHNDDRLYLEADELMCEAAAKACGIECEVECFPNGRCIGTNQYNEIVFDPLGNPADTAEMCAKLGVNTTYWWGSNEVECQCFFVKEFTEFFAYRTAEKDHDNSRLKAWMYAATMVAAKIGGYEDAHP